VILLIAFAAFAVWMLYLDSRTADGLIDGIPSNPFDLWHPRRWHTHYTPGGERSLRRMMRWGIIGLLGFVGGGGLFVWWAGTHC
jgi:hypothetical protein